MAVTTLQGELMEALGALYQLESFTALGDFLQGELLVLRYLADQGEESAYPSELSRALGLSPSRITGTLNALRRKELVTMDHSRIDRRRIQVRITDEGRARVGQKLHEMEQTFDRLLVRLGRQDAAALAALLRRCAQALDG